MIAVKKIIRYLEEERVRIRRDELDTQYMQGMVQGIHLSIAVIRELWTSTKGTRINNPFGISGGRK